RVLGLGSKRCVSGSGRSGSAPSPGLWLVRIVSLTIPLYLPDVVGPSLVPVALFTPVGGDLRRRWQSRISQWISRAAFWDVGRSLELPNNPWHLHELIGVTHSDFALGPQAFKLCLGSLICVAQNKVKFAVLRAELSEFPL